MPELQEAGKMPEIKMPGILMITAIAGAENCAAALSRQFQLGVETASSRREALAALRRREYLLVVIDESMIEAAEDGADGLFRHCGGALPLEVNFAISGYGRVARAVRAALDRREGEKEAASRAAASSMQIDLRQTLAGLLLQSQLALAEPGVPPPLAAKLGLVVALAGEMRQKLDRLAPVPGLARSRSVPTVENSPASGARRGPVRALPAAIRMGGAAAV